MATSAGERSCRESSFPPLDVRFLLPAGKDARSDFSLDTIFYSSCSSNF